MLLLIFYRPQLFGCCVGSRIIQRVLDFLLPNTLKIPFWHLVLTDENSMPLARHPPTPIIEPEIVKSSARPITGCAFIWRVAIYQ